MSIVVSVLALILALVALGLQLQARRRGPGADAAAGSDLPADALALRHEVAALRGEAASAFQHLAVVRYDAFSDLGGALSWSLALLDDHGDGILLTSIHGRSEARTYAKSISGWRTEQQLSPEEEQALRNARG